MGSRTEKRNYVEEKDLKEDVAALYETGEFPDRLVKNLIAMVDHVLSSHRWSFYTLDWKEEMRTDAIESLVRFLLERRYDPAYPNTKVFNWASTVIFMRFRWIAQKLTKEFIRKKQLEDFILTCATNEERELHRKFFPEEYCGNV